MSTLSPAEQTVIIQRVCGQTDWLKTVHFRENGTPVLICSRELKGTEKIVYGHNLRVEGIDGFDYEVVPPITSEGTMVFRETDPLCFPPGVTFDPLTGCLTISPESGVKRLVFPAGIKFTRVYPDP